MKIKFLPVLFLVAASLHAQLRITETYLNPDGSDTGTEWVEIQNTSNTTINLGNFSLAWSDSSSNPGWNALRSFGFNSTLLAPGAYAVVGGNLSRPRNGNPTEQTTSPLFSAILPSNNSNGRSFGLALFDTSGGAINNNAVNAARVDSVFYGSGSPAGQLAYNQTGVNGANIVLNFNNSVDAKGFQLTPNSTTVQSPRGGTPGWGLTEDVGGSASFLSRWTATPVTLATNTYAASLGMKDSDGVTMTSEWSSLVFKANGDLVVPSDNGAMIEMTTTGAFVRGAAPGKDPLNVNAANITAQGNGTGTGYNRGNLEQDFEGVTVRGNDGTGNASAVYALNERGTRAVGDPTPIGNYGASLYRMDPATFTVQQTFQFTDADMFHLDGERNFNLEGLAYKDTLSGNARFFVASEMNRSIYLYTLDEALGSLTRDVSFTLNLGGLYNENPKDLYWDSAASELYVINLSGNLLQLHWTGSAWTLDATYRVPETFRELGLEGMTIGADGALYLAQDGGNIYQFAPVAVPEPSVWALWAGGAALVSAIWRRRKLRQDRRRI